MQFENRFVRHLPGDPVLHNASRAVRNACYTPVHPTPVIAPRLLAWSDAVGEMLGIARPDSSSDVAAEVLAGNRILPGMEPYAARYGGHQFGHWAGQLGDGRAIILGEVVGPDGSRHELQLKGAGKTPYCALRTRAVLRSACVNSFEPCTRHSDNPCGELGGTASMWCMFYDDNPRPETGAIVCRVSPSFGALATLKSSRR